MVPEAGRLKGPPTRSKVDIRRAYEAHAKTVYKVCYGFFGRTADAEDATQETFIRLMKYDGAFDSDEHLKAWLIRVASNVCKDVLKSAEMARRGAALEDVPEPAAPVEEYDATRDVVMSLEPKYKDVVYLYYYEGYTSAEIAKILGKPPSTVRNLLSEARGILREKLGGEWR